MAENDIDLQELLSEKIKLEDLSPGQLKALNLGPLEIFDIKQRTTFDADQVLGVAAGGVTSQIVDNSDINKYIDALEKPTGSDVYSKQAAIYRAQGEGAVLRTQRDLRNLFLPTIDLIQKREAAAMARFTLLKNRMPEFDDTTIFGDQSDNPMPVADEIKNISAQTKEDLRMLSILSPNDERYEEIKNRVETNQKSIVEFDAVNKKLLEIRNAGTDESQWSKGMDPTTVNMWKDIYTSNGKNIKIQEGKLVWTDEKGTNIYDIPDDNTGGQRSTYDDETYEILENSKGNDTNSEQYKRGTALRQLHWYSDQEKYSGNLKDNKAENYRSDITMEIQNALNTLGITDNKGKALEVDGEFGPETREAYDKYLAQKSKLNKQHLDQYMTKEDAAKYRTKSGVGETKIIDLSQIGDGPITIHNGAVNQDIKIRGNAQELINKGIGIDEPMYNTFIKKEIATLNDVGPDGIKSLIFDGLRNDEDSIYAGMNTDTFLEQVISQHYGNDLSAAEIEEKIYFMRTQDVTQMYDNGKGGQDTLQTQFLEWYKKQIDQKIIEGKKQTLITDPNQKGGGKKSSSASLNPFEEYIDNFNKVRVEELYSDTATTDTTQSASFATQSASVELPTLPSVPVNYKGKRVDADNIRVTFENGQPFIHYFPEDPDTKIAQSRNEIIKIYQDAFFGENIKDADLKAIEQFVDEQIKNSEIGAQTSGADSTTKADPLATDVAMYQKVIEKTPADLYAKLDNLFIPNATIGGRKLEDAPLLFNYGSNTFVPNSLNREFGNYGFTFKYAGRKNALGIEIDDAVQVTHTNFPNRSFTILYDTNDDSINMKILTQIMQALYAGDLKAADKASSGDFVGFFITKDGKVVSKLTREIAKNLRTSSIK